eukprot:scaffold2364_cov126-Isochrysis_galbana.AAC.3
MELLVSSSNYLHDANRHALLRHELVQPVLQSGLEVAVGAAAAIASRKMLRMCCQQCPARAPAFSLFS